MDGIIATAIEKGGISAIAIVVLGFIFIKVFQLMMNFQKNFLSELVNARRENTETQEKTRASIEKTGKAIEELTKVCHTINVKFDNK